MRVTVNYWKWYNRIDHTNVLLIFYCNHRMSVCFWDLVTWWNILALFGATPLGWQHQNFSEATIVHVRTCPAVDILDDSLGDIMRRCGLFPSYFGQSCPNSYAHPGVCESLNINSDALHANYYCMTRLSESERIDMGGLLRDKREWSGCCLLYTSDAADE